MDYYTRDRSTPRTDTYWGGKSDLTASGGFEIDGVTTIIFRRSLETHEPTDHSIVDDLMHVIWARGQEPNKFVHFPLSGLEKETSSVPEFYKPDELKYHGHRSQRGFTQINFLEEPKPAETLNGFQPNLASHQLENDCVGYWRHPRDCSPEKSNCEYFVSWQTIGKGDEMRFKIQTTNTKQWTGIGFSDDEKMSQTDAVIGWVDENGRAFLMDTWINGYAPPKLDDKQDIYNASGSIKNGVTILEFTRKRTTSDQQDLSFTNDHCLYMMFPVQGGIFNAVNKKTRKHEQTPVVTDNRICIKSCEKELEQMIAVTTPAPNRLVYAVGVKLMNLAESFESPAKGTPEFNSLALQISDSFNGVLHNIPGYYKVDVTNFEKEKDTVIATMNVLFDKAAYEKGRSLKSDVENDIANEDGNDTKDGKVVKKILKDSLVSGKVGSLSVDPNYLDFEALEYKSSTNKSEPTASFFQLSEVRLYIVLGLIAALIVVALLQAACTIYKTSKSSRNQKDQLIPNSAWKDYSTNTNYGFDAFGETEEKHKRSRSSSSQQTLQMSHSPAKPQYHNEGRSSRHDNTDGNRYQHNGENGRGYQNGDNIPRTSYADRTYSLPRTVVQQQQQLQKQTHPGYYTQDRRNRNTQHSVSSASAGIDQPDFYFMPSQRKYSGEVVRV